MPRTCGQQYGSCWAELTGRHQQPVIVDSIDANSLNGHKAYANVSTDLAYYVMPPAKLTATRRNGRAIGSQITVCLCIIDSLKSAATGLDGLPCVVLTARCSSVLQDHSWSNQPANKYIYSALTVDRHSQATSAPFPCQWRSPPQCWNRGGGSVFSLPQ